MRYSFVHDILLVIVMICASGVLSLDDSLVVAAATKPNVRNPSEPVMQTTERIGQDIRHDRIDQMTSTKLGRRLRRSLGDQDEEDPPISPTEDLLPSNCTVIALDNSLGPSRPTSDVTLKRTFCAAAAKLARFDFYASAGGIYFLDTTGSECQDTVMIAWASSASSTSDVCKDDPAVTDPATADSARCLDDFFPTKNYYAAMMIQAKANQIITMLVGSFSDQCFREGKTVTVKVEHLTSAPSPKLTETASPTLSSSPSALTESPSFLSSSSTPSTSPSVSTTGSPSSSSSPSTSPSVSQVTASPSSSSSPSASPSKGGPSPSSSAPSTSPSINTTGSSPSSPSTSPSISATTTTPSLSPVPQTSSRTMQPSTSPTFVQTTSRDIPSSQPSSAAPSTSPASEYENDEYEYEQEYEYEYEEYEFSKTLSPTTSPIASVHPEPTTEDNAGSTSSPTTNVTLPNSSASGPSSSPTTATEEPETVKPNEDEYEYEMFSNLRSKAAQEDKARLKRHQFV